MPRIRRNVESDTLTAREEEFCRLVGLEETSWVVDAYRQAFGSDYKWVRTECYRLMQMPKIRARIASYRQLIAEAVDDSKITAERVANELARIAFSRVDDIFGWDAEGKPMLKPSSEMSPEALSAISEITFTARGVKVKMADKRPALEALLKVIREQDGSDTDDPAALLAEAALIVAKRNQGSEGDH